MKVLKTLYDKVFDSHVVSESNGNYLIYIDRHLVHEVTSPQAFQALTDKGRVVKRPDLTLSTIDHNIPTTTRTNYTDIESFISNKDSRIQVQTLQANVKKFGLTFFGLDDARQGIVHIIGPEQGFTLPGTTVVCGDSHTSTHGAFGALAFGIGTSEVEHVLATQTLLLKKSKNMLIECDGELSSGVSSKDLILYIIGKIGIAGGTGHVIEYAGSAIRNLSMDARMSMCNMSIEAGARAGMISPDQTTFEYLRNRPLAPKYAMFEDAVKYWRTLKADEGAEYDVVVKIDCKDIAPCVTWGTTPEDVLPINGIVPQPLDFVNLIRRKGVERSLEYMGIQAGQKLVDLKIDKVFIGSCTNGRIEDLRAGAAIAYGRKVAKGVYAMVVPGSGLVKLQAEAEGLSQIFIDAGFDWREAGCSMCLGMNEDQLKPFERCASTSNRNFEGRQGFKGRTHLMSPAMACAAAISGHLCDVREFTNLSDRKQIITDPKVYLSDFTDSDYIHAEARPIVNVSIGGIEKFTILQGVSCPLSMSNIDTDKIIPKQFLKTIKRTGLGSALFHELRYLADGSPDPEFVLNKPRYMNSKILIANENFGCGSSREHAPWALLDFGIRCIIAPSFADIFESNTTKNGMLPISLPQSFVDVLMADAELGEELLISLPDQTITRYNGLTISFEIAAFRKECLINGYDDIALSLLQVKDIENFELNRTQLYPWLDGEQYGKRIIVSEQLRTDW